MNREVTERDGLNEFVEALAHCINVLLDAQAPGRGSFPSGWGQFRVVATRETREHIQLHVDAGILSRVAHIFGDVHAEVVRKEGTDRVWLVLVPRRTS
jgi:hypothetical protein